MKAVWEALEGGGWEGAEQMLELGTGRGQPEARLTGVHPGFEAPLSRVSDTVRSGPEMGALREVKQGLCGSSGQSSHTEGAGKGLLWGPGGWAPSSSSEGPTFFQ